MSVAGAEHPAVAAALADVHLAGRQRELGVAEPAPHVLRLRHRPPHPGRRCAEVARGRRSWCRRASAPDGEGGAARGASRVVLRGRRGRSWWRGSRRGGRSDRPRTAGTPRPRSATACAAERPPAIAGRDWATRDRLTSPARSSTRRCLETAGPLIANGRPSSPTVAGPAREPGQDRPAGRVGQRPKTRLSGSRASAPEGDGRHAMSVIPPTGHCWSSHELPSGSSKRV